MLCRLGVPHSQTWCFSDEKTVCSKWKSNPDTPSRYNTDPLAMLAVRFSDRTVLTPFCPLYCLDIC